MVDGDLFDKLARVAGMIRKKTEPFGGIQVTVYIHHLFCGTNCELDRRDW